ncbi:hypothetical protein U1E44_02085 [Arenibacter sp. GZD96]|uniref:hypothetical protein n=1 Tax=Aurantibrevibacter litoralis TaxID=3106030 RepID=UPI002AFFFB30|nr:hypothetical protein [Arenibacter sp. GZD-96]MEA1784869.1 hypothetical protein [Arenibacter sp. GZD-96]
MKEFRTAILIIASIIVVILKLHYDYYHFIFPLILVALFYVYEIKNMQNGLLKSISIVFISLNIIVTVLPDALIYKTLFSNWHYWSEKELRKEHFKGEPMEDLNATAAVYPSIIGKFSKVYNFPSSIIFTADNSKNSWIKKELFEEKDSNALKKLLRHEKRHLDLTEVYRRKAMDSIEKLRFPSIEEKYKLIEYYYKISDSINDVFDLETEHGLNPIGNKKWADYLDTQLGLK